MMNAKHRPIVHSQSRTQLYIIFSFFGTSPNDEVERHNSLPRRCAHIYDYTSSLINAIKTLLNWNYLDLDHCLISLHNIYI